MVHFQGLDMSCRYYTTSYRHLVWKQRCFWPTFTLLHCKYLVHTKHSVILLIQGHNCRILAGKTTTVASTLPVCRRCGHCILFCKIQARPRSWLSCQPSRPCYKIQFRLHFHPKNLLLELSAHHLGLLVF